MDNPKRGARMFMALFVVALGIPTLAACIVAWLR
jgi:hypothetical protein